MISTNLRTIYRNLRFNKSLHQYDNATVSTHSYNPRIDYKDKRHNIETAENDSQTRLYKGKPIHRINW